MSIAFPSSIDDAAAADGTYRAGGTDLQEWLACTGDRPDLVDLADVDDLVGTTVDDNGAVRIGAATTVATVATELTGTHPAVAATAGGLATPQVRAVATLGGNLLQATRCWYARHPDVSCRKTGGDHCPARGGRHDRGVVFDRSSCVHPHPSSLGMALVAHDATVEVARRADRPVADLFGDGTDATRDHLLPPGDLLVAVHLPPPWPGESGAYRRTITRFEAEWPIVEAVARVQRDDGGRVVRAAVALGGVATVPVLVPHVADVLVDTMLDDDTIATAAEAATVGANPLPGTAWKVDLVAATVRDVLEDLAAA